MKKINRPTGFYRCNDIEFNSKIDVLLYSKTVNQPVEWIFHKNTYDQYPWHIEPETDLDELYNRRARELREKYDYIIVSYSGDADSHNVVESFLRQGLHIDEIIVTHLDSYVRDMTILDTRVCDGWNINAEYQLQVLPRLGDISAKYPAIKITDVNVELMVLDSFKRFVDPDWWIYHSDDLSMGQMSRYLFFYPTERSKLFGPDQNIGFISGLHKPRVMINNQGLVCLQFLDHVANDILFADNLPQIITPEMFYWQPDCADIVCKQAHIIKHWLEQNFEQQHLWREPDYKTTRCTHDPLINRLIYNTWNDSWFQANKSINIWHTEYDTWIKINPEFSQEVYQWQKSLDTIVNQLPQHILPNYLCEADRFRPFEKTYTLGHINADLPHISQHYYRCQSKSANGLNHVVSTDARPDIEGAGKFAFELCLSAGIMIDWKEWYPNNHPDLDLSDVCLEITFDDVQIYKGRPDRCDTIIKHDFYNHADHLLEISVRGIPDLPLLDSREQRYGFLLHDIILDQRPVAWLLGESCCWIPNRDTQRCFSNFISDDGEISVVIKSEFPQWLGTESQYQIFQQKDIVTTNQRYHK
jgi:hypothetical protein